MARRVTQREYEALAAFRYGLRRFLRSSEDAAQAVGLTPQQHQALLAIRGTPSGTRATVGFLAERLQIRHHSAVGLVNRLVAQGLVTRKNFPEDGRVVGLGLSPAGEALLDQLAGAHRRELRRTAAELKELLRLIE